jgi:hypothetical protein
MASHFVDLALWRRSNPEDCSRATGDLCAACIVNDLSYKSQADGLCLKHEHIFFAINLHRHLGLTEALPLAQDGMRWIDAEQALVTGQRCMPALSGDLACIVYQYRK